MRTRILVAAAVLCSSFPLWAGTAGARGLTFEERVSAQEALERVYHSHQVGTTRPFEEAVPKDLLEEKVRTYLKQSVALEKFWGEPITGEMLRREMERMAAGTRMPERLREMFSALGNDPFLIQECLARPALVTRRVQGRFAGDPLLHASARAEAEALRARLAGGEVDSRRDHVLREVVESEPGTARVDAVEPVHERADSFVVRAPLGADRTAVYRIPKRAREDWWRSVEATLDPAAVTAVASTEAPLPVPAAGADATLLLGQDGSLPQVPAAAACDSDDTWDAGTFDDPLPTRRAWHSAVWTGNWMIVWGGRDAFRALGTGGLYDPATDTWTMVSMTGAPSLRWMHTAEWTGSEMVVWGGQDVFGAKGDGAAYEPWSDTWRPVASSGAPSARTGHSATWTGSVMVVWGGYDGSVTTYGDGAVYDPFADSWMPLATEGAPTARTGHVAVLGEVLEGEETEPVVRQVLVVWGGRYFESSTGQWAYLNTGGRYFLDTGVWLPTRVDPPVSYELGYEPVPTPAPSARADHAGGWRVWTESTYVSDPTPEDPNRTTLVDLERRHVVLWGGKAGTSFNTGALYDPARDLWRNITIAGAPSARWNHRLLVIDWMERRTKTGQIPPYEDITVLGMVVWGGEDEASRLFTGSRLVFEKTGPIWGATSVNGQPPARSGHSAVWTGLEFIVWGGVDGTRYLNSGGRYRPVRLESPPQPTGPANSWAATRAVGPSRSGHTGIWTGNFLLVWGGRDSDGYLAGGSRYDPVTANWTAISDLSEPSPREGHSAIWTGSSMVVWGGANASTRFNTGGIYELAADKWTAVAVTTGVPTARTGHSTVWTGTTMVVWGGVSGSTYFNSGGRYVPSTNSWNTVATTGAPTSRADHSAVWSGSQMILFGGRSTTGPLGNGARYDPVGNVWLPLSTANAPSARSKHAALWTGSRMILWGGLGSGGAYPADGKRYDPVLGVWEDMGLGGGTAPTGRIEFPVVWTGTEMIVWGGADATTKLGDGGRYDPSWDGWTTMSSDLAPSARHRHVGAWMGNFLLIWGGTSATGQYLADGGRYALGHTIDNDGDGYTECDGDCNDANSAVRPFAAEACNNYDDDCDGLIDEGTPKTTFYRDSDGDTFGNATKPIDSCVVPVGYVATSSLGFDCNDANAFVYPGRAEVCDGIDQDCDLYVDEGVLIASYPDPDGDSIGDWNGAVTTCTVPEGNVFLGGDNCLTTRNGDCSVMATCDLDHDSALSVEELAIGNCAILAKLSLCDLDPDGLGEEFSKDGALSAEELSAGGQCDFLYMCDVDLDGLLTESEIEVGLQADLDGDRVGDACDICLENPDPGQGDWDGDGYGDGCEFAPLLADADLSGRIDALDLAWMGREWGTRSQLPVYDNEGKITGYVPNPTFAFALDFTIDGLIDGEDLSILAASFGLSSGVPTPIAP